MSFKHIEPLPLDAAYCHACGQTPPDVFVDADNITWTGREMRVSCICNQCGADWEDTYRLLGRVETIEPPVGAPRFV